MEIKKVVLLLVIVLVLGEASAQHNLIIFNSSALCAITSGICDFTGMIHANTNDKYIVLSEISNIHTKIDNSTWVGDVVPSATSSVLINSTIPVTVSIRMSYIISNSFRVRLSLILISNKGLIAKYITLMYLKAQQFKLTMHHY